MKTRFTLLLLLVSFVANSQKNINFSASSTSISLGDSVLLSWKVQNLKKVTAIRIKKLKENLPPEGSIYVKPKESQKYYLQVVTGKNKHRYTKRVNIDVKSPQILKFSTSKDKNNDEDSTVIVWQTENCSKILLNHEIPLEPSGSLSFLLRKDTTFSLTIYNKNNVKVEKQLTISIENIEYLKGKRSIVLRDTLKLRWSFKNSKKVRIKGLDKDYKVVDNESFILEKDTLLVFQVFRNNGDTSLSFFNVKILPPVSKFTLSSLAYKKTKGTLQWSVHEGFSAKLDVGDSIITRLKGRLKVPATTDKSYRLKVYDSQNVLVFDETKNIRKVVSPVKYFKVSKHNIAGGEPIIMSWNVASSFSVRIEGIGSNLPNKHKIEVVPLYNKNYRLIVSHGKYGDIDTANCMVEVTKRRKFVKKVKDISELAPNNAIHFEIFAIDESKYPDEVKLYILAVDEQGNFIKGLTKKNKRQTKKLIKEIIDISGSKRKKISKFSFSEHQENISFPYDISLALDYSGSMYGTVKSLEKSVETFVKNKHKTDKISVTRFDHTFMKMSDLEQNADSLLSRLTPNGMDSLGGGTALYAGSDFAMQATDKSNNNKVLIMFTDGMENSSMAYYLDYAFSATTLAKKAKRNRVTIHVVGYGDGVNNSVLQKLAYTTGGNFYKLYTPRDVNALFKELPIILKNFYVLTYKPIVKKGKHAVKMVYNNFKGQYVSLQTNYQIGTDFTIDEKEPGVADTYWQIAADKIGKQPISVPQAIVFFDFNKADLKDNYMKAVDTYIKFLEAKPNASVIIMGHTDSKGSEESCKELGKKRAEEVKKYLESKGVDSQRIHIFSYGKNEPIWEPEDMEWKAKTGDLREGNPTDKLLRIRHLPSQKDPLGSIQFPAPCDRH